MRFIVDAQLPPALVGFIEDAGHEAIHVSELGLESASDQRIWQTAAEQNAVIITKDEDFIRLRSLRSDGPAIVWVRIGNTTPASAAPNIPGQFPKDRSCAGRGRRSG